MFLVNSISRRSRNGISVLPVERKEAVEAKDKVDMVDVVDETDILSSSISPTILGRP